MTSQEFDDLMFRVCVGMHIEAIEARAVTGAEAGALIVLDAVRWRQELRPDGEQAVVDAVATLCEA
jgi:hypothetical protein